jgi:RimJ/RimL family protein N-acetyltransferase
VEGAVQLVPLAEGHAEASLRWVSDPEIAGAIGLEREPSEESTREFIERARTDDSIAAFAIIAGGEHVGNVVLDVINPRLGTARFSIYLGEAEARGRGVGRAAAEQVLEHAFGPLGLHKVWLTVHARNEPAIRAYEACGFRVEGTLRDEFILDGERLDVLRMGILAGEHDSP